MDTFRILAYGGNSYSERARVGRWPAIECGAMGDRYAAQEEAISFGVGLTGGIPFLILRQLQDSRRRGGYPYTVLVDPGREVWEKVGWNGALLAKQLLADPEMAEMLLRRVEDWDEGAMAAFVHRLDRHTEQAYAADDTPALNHLWLGVQSRETPLIVSSRDGVFDGLVEPAALARCLAKLPICFRVGSGWLIGGGKVQAKAYGTMLVFDPDSDEPTPAVLPLTGGGATIGAAWEKLQESGECGPAIDVLAEIPMHEWPFPVDKILTAAHSRQAAIIHEAARQLADRGQIPPEAGSSYALWWNVVRGGNLTVRQDQLGSAWDRLLLREDGAPPDLLRKALSSDWARRQKVATVLTQASVEHTIANCKPLAEWQRSATDPLFPSGPRTRLCSEAHRRAITGLATRTPVCDWLNDYLAFGDDVTGEHLWGMMGSSSNDIASRVVAELVTVARHKQQASRWLQSLASSIIRAGLPTSLKLKAAEVAGKQWEWFLLLHRLWQGTADLDQNVPSREREALIRDLDSMLTEHTCLSWTPNLEGIVRLLVELPTETQRHLARMEPPLRDLTAAKRWWTGWKLLQREDLVRSEKARFLASGKVAAGPVDGNFIAMRVEPVFDPSTGR